MFTLQQLAAELTADPKALGYAAPAGAGKDGAVAALLNATYAGVGTVWKPAVAAADLLGSLVDTEVAAWSAVQWTALTALLIPGTVDATNARIRALFARLLPAQSLANATAAAQVAAPTRAEELWGAGTIVTTADVAHALRGGSL